MGHVSGLEKYEWVSWNLCLRLRGSEVGVCNGLGFRVCRGYGWWGIWCKLGVS